MSGVECALEGCDRAATSNANGQRVCRMHWSRWYKHGTFEVRRFVSPPRPARLPCVVDGCANIDDGPHGYCKMHKSRVDRHGDPSVVIPHKKRNFPRGQDHPHWSDDESITYNGVHLRLKHQRGSASAHPCVDCGESARQWSYDRTDPDVRLADEGPFSVDLARYVPRCVSCHKRFDLRHTA